MSLVQFNKVSKQYLGTYILEDIDFNINAKDKIGLIGLNGVGKSTIIRMLLNEENNDEGNIVVNPNVVIGYLSQEHDFSDEENNIYDEVLSVFSKQLEIKREMEITKDTNRLMKLTEEYEKHDGYEVEYKVKQILTGLEIFPEEYSKIIKDLSGGEKTRVLLAKLLLTEPDLLVLDEPTNHLDIVSIEWLEDYLKKYNKAFILISHDRIFLDNVCNKIYEIENRKIHKYNGNFTDFLIQKEMIIKGELKSYEKEQDKIKKIEEYITRYKAGIKSKQARGRQKILERMERMDNPIFSPNRMKLKFTTDTSTGDNVIKVNNIIKTYDDRKVLNNISFNLYKGDRVGIIGKNGIGKSTLLKILVDDIKADSGNIEYGARVKKGYYDQDHQELTDENTILQEINTSLSYTEEYLRGLAGGFLFSGEDIDKKISKLSGGEKVRVSFLKLMMNKPNLLLLDEPTNHLDIYSIEILEDALKEYDGSLLVVSHNRHFLDEICNKIYYLDENGLIEFKGNYINYKESISSKNEVKIDKEEKKNQYKLKKENEKIYNKIQKEIKKLEEEIEIIEKNRNNLNKEMDLEGKKNNVEKLIEIQEKLDKLDELELLLLQKWDKKNEELEEYENKKEDNI